MADKLIKLTEEEKEAFDIDCAQDPRQEVREAIALYKTDKKAALKKYPYLKHSFDRLDNKK